MRNALLTVAPFAERCLHDLTSLNMNEKCQVMSGFERSEADLREPKWDGFGAFDPGIALRAVAPCSRRPARDDPGVTAVRRVQR